MVVHTKYFTESTIYLYSYNTSVLLLQLQSAQSTFTTDKCAKWAASSCCLQCHRGNRQPLLDDWYWRMFVLDEHEGELLWEVFVFCTCKEVRVLWFQALRLSCGFISETKGKRKRIKCLHDFYSEKLYKLTTKRPEQGFKILINTKPNFSSSFISRVEQNWQTEHWTLCLRSSETVTVREEMTSETTLPIMLCSHVKLVPVCWMSC